MFASPRFLIGVRLTPGAFIGIITMLMPLCLGASGSVRTAHHSQSA